MTHHAVGARLGFSDKRSHQKEMSAIRKIGPDVWRYVLRAPVDRWFDVGTTLEWAELITKKEWLWDAPRTPDEWDKWVGDRTTASELTREHARRGVLELVDNEFQAQPFREWNSVDKALRIIAEALAWATAGLFAPSGYVNSRGRPWRPLAAKCLGAWVNAYKREVEDNGARPQALFIMNHQQLQAHFRRINRQN